MLRALRVEGLSPTEYTGPARGDDMLIRSFMLKECARCGELHAERTDGTWFPNSRRENTFMRSRSVRMWRTAAT